MAYAMLMRRGGKSGKMPPVPEYTGTMNLVYLSEDGLSGYAEFTSTGTLTWMNDWIPEGTKFDLFCVGGGGGTSGSGGSQNYNGRAGAGGGYTATVKGVELPHSVSIVIGSGGAAGSGTTSSGNRGGTTSISDLCVAEGGYGNSAYTGGNGGSGGGRGGAGGSGTTDAQRHGGDGGSNGSDGNGGTYGTNGKGQGSPTTDLLGRKHAGGGSGSSGYSPSYGVTTTPNGGASDFTSGSGSDNTSAKGGGGYGGGGGGARSNSNGAGSGYGGSAGGPGFAMIGWGDYFEVFNRVIELDYIQSTGTQRINTGLSMPNGFTAKMKVSVAASSAAQALIGAIDDASPYYRNYFSVLANLTQWNVGAYDDLACGSAISADTAYELEFSTVPGNVYCKINGVTQSIGTPTGSVRSAKEIYLFNVNYAYPFPASAKMHCCQIFDENGNLVRDYVPAKRERDNAIGMKDKVNDVFCANAGTGMFIAGPEV